MNTVTDRQWSQMDAEHVYLLHSVALRAEVKSLRQWATRHGHVAHIAPLYDHGYALVVIEGGSSPCSGVPQADEGPVAAAYG